MNGNIELFGRIDNQIKLRGFRIEPGEIENLLAQLNGIREAVVKVHKFEDNDERLVAFLNVNPEFKLTRQEITGSLSRHLPAYMIPSLFQVSDGFPKLPNGKINKNLIFLETDKQDIIEKNSDECTSTQKRLIIIWEKILKIRNIAITDNFFNIGGNSLLALTICSKISSEFRVDLDFRIFYDTPRIKDLAETIDNLSNRDKTEKPVVKTEGTGSNIISGEI